MEIKSKKYHCELRNRKATIDVVKCFRKFIPPFRYLLPLLTLLLMYFSFQYMHWQVLGSVGYHDGGVQLLSWTAFDVSVFFLISLVLTGFARSVKLTCSMAFGLCIIFCISNIAYSRIFNSYLSCSFWNQTGNLPLSEILRYFFGALRCKDFLLLFLCVFFAFLIGRLHIDKSSVPWAFCLLPFVIGLLLYACFIVIKVTLKSETFEMVCAQNKFIPTSFDEERFDSRRFVSKLGLVRADWLFTIRNDFVGQRHLTAVERQQIKKFLYRERATQQQLFSLPSENPNVVVLLCESYLSCTSDLKIGNKELTPNLNRLRHDSLTFYNGNIESGVGVGESSDGQFMYMTGLRPLKHAIAADYAIKSNIPCFEQYMEHKGYETHMTIPTLRTVWQQDQLCPKYHIRHLHDALEFGETDYWLADDRLIKFAETCEKHMKCPFLHFILTSSMHSPYNHSDLSIEKCNCLPNDFPKTYTKEYCNYLKKVHYMDHQIGYYVEHLKKIRRWENTVLIILSDHGVRDIYTKMPAEAVLHNRIPLYICNVHKRRDLSQFEQKKMEQVDVFPTLLDLFSIRSIYRGVGRSLFEDMNENDVEKAENVSRLILEGGFFSEVD